MANHIYAVKYPPKQPKFGLNVNFQASQFKNEDVTQE